MDQNNKVKEFQPPNKKIFYQTVQFYKIKTKKILNYEHKVLKNLNKHKKSLNSEIKAWIKKKI